MTTASAVSPNDLRATKSQTWIARLGLPSLGAAAVALTSASLLPTLCPFRLCTGHACPGCGITRGIASAVKGDLGLSFRYHPMAIVIGVQLLALWSIAVFGGRTGLTRVGRPAAVLALANVAVMVVVWVVRWQLGLLDFVTQN